jgi:hypothetical protein
MPIHPAWLVYKKSAWDNRQLAQEGVEALEAEYSKAHALT